MSLTHMPGRFQARPGGTRAGTAHITRAVGNIEQECAERGKENRVEGPKMLEGMALPVADFGDGL